jgi:DNA-binding HxlR family transcriptional regulator
VRAPVAPSLTDVPLLKKSKTRPLPARPATPIVQHVTQPAPPEPGVERAAGIAARVGSERAGAILRSSQVAMAFEALGDRWSALVLREVFLGARRFEELVVATGASRATLTLRLRSLVEEGVLHRHPYQARPTRYEYRLTRMGADLYATALMYWLWEKLYGETSGTLPRELVHTPCGHSMLPVLVCRRCRKPIDIASVHVELVAEPDERQVRLPKHCLHTGPNSWRERDGQTVHAIDVIGDRWTSLVQAATYYGLHRFADIQTALAVPTNTLSDRLRLLVQAGVLSRAQYQDNPPRYAYRLTDKGRALYLPAFTLHQWADRWLLRGRVAPIRLVHRTCGAVAEGVAVCDQCREELRPADVEPRSPARRNAASSSPQR